MYKKQSVFKNRKIGEMFIEGLRGHKVIFKKGMMLKVSGMC